MQDIEIEHEADDIEHEPRPSKGIDIPVQNITADTRDRVKDVLYSNRLGLRRYEILPVENEVLQEWKRQIEEIREALRSKDRALIWKASIRNEKCRTDLDSIEELLGSEVLEETDLTLLAIGLWTLREKSRWKGALQAGLKLLKGGRHKLSSFLEREGNSTCLDLCVLSQELARLFGIEGDIYTIDKLTSRFAHRHWESRDGKILDINYAWRRGGFFRNREEYQAYLANNQDLPAKERAHKNYVKEAV